jgi:hypothetical protein
MQQYLEYSEHSQKLNPYNALTNPILHWKYRQLKEQRKLYLEELGFDSRNKAFRIIFGHLQSFVAVEHLENDRGYSQLTQERDSA